MSKLLKVCLDIEGNDRGLAVTTVATSNSDEAFDKARNHVGVTDRKSEDKVSPLQKRSCSVQKLPRGG